MVSARNIYSLCPKMIVLHPGLGCFKMIVGDQMFIDFVVVENFAWQFGVSNNFYTNKINKHLILDNQFETKNSGVGQSFWDIIVLHYFGSKTIKSVFISYLGKVSSKLVVSSRFHLHAFMSSLVWSSWNQGCNFVRFFGVSHLWYLFQELIQCIWHKQTRSHHFRLQPIYLLWYDFFPVILSFFHDHTMHSFIGWLWLSWEFRIVFYLAYSSKIVLSLISWDAYAQHHDWS